MYMLSIVILISICLLIIYGVFTIYYLIKNDVTCNHHIRIVEAIAAYKKHCILYGSSGSEDLVNYDDMEDYDKTLWRLWDWGYKRILPKEKYELIKEYIGGRNNEAT